MRVFGEVLQNGKRLRPQGNLVPFKQQTALVQVQDIPVESQLPGPLHLAPIGRSHACSWVRRRVDHGRPVLATLLRLLSNCRQRLRKSPPTEREAAAGPQRTGVQTRSGQRCDASETTACEPSL